MQITKIDTTNESTINSSLKVGMIIRNSSNRTFKISALTDKKIQLTSLNGETVKNTIFNREVFSQLYARKNYDQVINTKNPTADFMEAKRIGATRFMIK